MADTLFWYDLETFGRNPALDRVAQFAGIRTNDRFEPLGEPHVFYCTPTPDYVPDPLSCLITGITPADAAEKGESEYRFVSRIRELFLEPGTCVVGYNSLRFDDEFVRNMLYRNFYDPYEREYSSGNSRWDVVDLMRAAHDFRPDGIEWPRNEEDKPSFKLEDLAAANGIEQERAHDALSDVRATIGLARLVHEKQPKLFRYLFSLRRKKKVYELIDLYHRRPFAYTSRVFSRKEGCTTAVAPLAPNPRNPNEVLVYDLRYDPRALIDGSVEELRSRIFTRDAAKRIPVTGVAVNRSPAISPLSALERDGVAERLNINLKECRKHAEMLAGEHRLTQKITQVYDRPPEAGGRDPELQLYSGGFFPDSDREEFERIHRTSRESIPRLQLSCEDPRVPELFRRFVWRNFEDLLSPESMRKWRSFCASRILMPPGDDVSDFAFFSRKIDEHLARSDLDGQAKVVLRKLADYRDYLKREVLEYR